MADNVLSAAMLTNLYESGIVDSTIAAAGIRPASGNELPAVPAVQEAGGFAIPYRDIRGRRDGYVRVRLLAGANKYYQKGGSGTRIYLPPDIPTATYLDPRIPIIITEGEKKAIKGAQEGFNVIALGGVENWRNRSFKIPLDLLDTASTKYAMLKIPPNSKALDILYEQVAPELLDIVWDHRRVLICFDTDKAPNPDVQRAAFDLALWLDGKGASVAQLRLPAAPGTKIGLDDYLVLHGKERLAELMADTAAQKFPAPMYPRSYITRKMNNRPDREDQLKIARTVIADLDSRGTRYYDDKWDRYYFDSDELILHQFGFKDDLRDSTFGNLIRTKYGIGTSDTAMVNRIKDDFASVSPIQRIVPRTVSYSTHNHLYYQVSDSEMLRVGRAGVELVNNGTDNVLFRADQVIALDTDRLQTQLRNHSEVRPPLTRWQSALRSLRIQPMYGMTYDDTITYLDTLYHLSPYLQRWRGLMLPLEIIVAEPNSGKSFLQNLRKGVYTGRPGLEAMPSDERNLFSSIANSSLWVIDNVVDIPRSLSATLSDFLAHLITDPEPNISLRRLYTTNSQDTYPITCSFVVTGTTNPFTRPDLLQRSVEYNMRAVPDGQRVSNWYMALLEDREGWVAEQMVAVQRFFQLVNEHWVADYRSSNRLVHYDQAMLLMGQAIGYSPETMARVIAGSAGHIVHTVTSQDFLFDALRKFKAATEAKTKQTTLTDFSSWTAIQSEEEWFDMPIFARRLKLRALLERNRYDIFRAVGIHLVEDGERLLLIFPGHPDYPKGDAE